MGFRLPLPGKNKTIGAHNVPTGGLADSFKYAYHINYKNWYQAFPYVFSFQPRGSEKDEEFLFNLPITPQNLTITTNYATNIITTLYGVVEEHSEVRYYDIQISGTTGFSPNSNVLNIDKDQKGEASTGFKQFFQAGGRTSFAPILDLSLGGFATRTMNIINQIVNQTVELAFGEDNDSGIALNTTGYVAFHNLYRFFLLYKEDASANSNGPNNFTTDKERKRHPLTFLNYKDNTKYDCVPLTFTLTRDVNNPMLYNYHIKLRAYNLRQVDTPFTELNEKDAQKKQLTDMGLVNSGGAIQSQSLFNKIISKASIARSIIAGTISGLSTLGQ